MGIDDIVNEGTVIYTGANIFSQVGVGDSEDLDGVALGDIFAAVGANPFTGIQSGVLADNGGPVETVAIKDGGVAHDNGVNAALPATDPRDLDGDGNTTEALPVDARGPVRVVGTSVDIGAFEAGNLRVTTLVDELDAADTSLATANLDDLSLREALAIANSDPFANTITFDDKPDRRQHPRRRRRLHRARRHRADICRPTSPSTAT